MSIGIRVQGGTGAGRKRPLREKPKPWQCDCWVNAETGTATLVGKQQPAHIARCTDCGTERPS